MRIAAKTAVLIVLFTFTIKIKLNLFKVLLTLVYEKPVLRERWIYVNRKK